jgi:type III restriction enzyme
MKLARAIANDEIEPDAEDLAFALLVGVLKDEYARVKDTETFAKLVDERTEVEIRAVDWQVGLEAVGDETTVKLKVSSENIDDMFEEAGRRIGDEGLHKEWWKTRRKEKADNTRAKLELVALSIDPGVRKRLEKAAQEQVGKWLVDNNHAISLLPERRGKVYYEIRAQAPEPELRAAVVLPPDLTVAKSETTWKRHVYCDADGDYPATLNKWESAVVKGELANDKKVVWLRNIPRKPWAITIPYEPSGKVAPFYPDFLFLREKGGEWVCDLLDPHLIELADAPAKAVGLAKYAAKHSFTFGRIELIIVQGDDIRRIDLTNEANREKVLTVKTKEHLAHLFDELS